MGLPAASMTPPVRFIPSSANETAAGMTKQAVVKRRIRPHLCLASGISMGSLPFLVNRLIGLAYGFRRRCQLGEAARNDEVNSAYAPSTDRRIGGQPQPIVRGGGFGRNISGRPETTG